MTGYKNLETLQGGIYLIDISIQFFPLQFYAIPAMEYSSSFPFVPAQHKLVSTTETLQSSRSIEI